VTISIYILLASEFFLRYFADKPLRGKEADYHSLNANRGRGRLDGRLRIMTCALVFNTTCLLIRSVKSSLPSEAHKLKY
jgi:hypothetical protein